MQEIHKDSRKALLKAKQAVDRLLKIRLRSEQEIRSRLLLKQFPDEVISEVINFYKELGLIDDRQFAKRWIVSRQSKPYGLNRIRFELKNKGISEQILNEELSAGFENFSEDQVVCQLAKRRAEKYTNIEPEKRRKRIYDYLQRRGFSQKSIIKAIKNYDC